MVAAETASSAIAARVVLVVDCCSDSSIAVGPLLTEAFGAYSVAVTDSAGAMRWLSKVRPSAALICLGVDGGGLELIERMRHELPMADVPIVVMGGPGDRETALSAGCVAFLRKPLVAAEVVRVLTPLL